MTLSEARKILGLRPDEDPRQSLSGFKEARERLAEMVRNAPNDALALRYQQELVNFDRALAAVREATEQATVIAEPVIEKKPEVVISAPAPVAVPASSGIIEPRPIKKPVPTQKLPEKTGTPARAVWTLALILLIAAGGLFYWQYQEKLAVKDLSNLPELEKQGALLIENRRWPDATKVFDEIEALTPNSEKVAEARRKIEAGMVEEQTQFVGYWTGQARASLEAGRWDEATAAAKQVLEKFPQEKEPVAILAEIEQAKAAEADRALITTARDQLHQRKWDEAIASATKILASRPADEDAKKLISEATAGKEKAAADLVKARSLFEQAQARDQGQFDQQVLEWLREAAALAPDDAEIKAQLEKISSYSRTVRVPGDFATPAEALANARDRDRIVIAAGTWTGPLTVNASVDLQGAGSETTIIQCPAKENNVITFGPAATGTRISGFSFRHESFDADEERFSGGLIRGSTVDLVDCKFIDASGHGLVAIEGGHAIVNRCQFTGNGWDGIAASGPGSLLEVRASESTKNYGHGIESWDGAAVILTENRCEDNSRNGIHADNGGGSVTLEKNQLIGNREFGMVLSSAGSGRITGNSARGNQLGGLVVRSTASGVTVSGNEFTKNEGPGLVLDIGLLAAPYAQNTSNGNGGQQQIVVNANLTAPAAPEPPAPNPNPAPAAPKPGSAPASPTTPPRAIRVIEQ